MAATAQMSITAAQCVEEYAVCMTSIVPTFLRRRVSAFNCKRDGVVRDAEVSPGTFLSKEVRLF